MCIRDRLNTKDYVAPTSFVFKDRNTFRMGNTIEMCIRDSYVTAESVKFTIKDTADVQKVEMKDDVTKVKISRQDIAGKELPGAKLTILDPVSYTPLLFHVSQRANRA